MRLVYKIILVGLFFGMIFLFWFENKKTYPVSYGVSFSAEHASWLGLDWRQTYVAILEDLHVKYIRIPVAWDKVEPADGIYDFGDLDWQMEKAVENNVKVVLAVGQKTPRWPECRVPSWAAQGNEIKVHAQLLEYVNTVVKRYQNNPALDFWQVENEPFIKFKFGNCNNFYPEWTGDEILGMHAVDPNHKIMVTDSGELGFWYEASEAGDIFGTTVYQRTRNKQGRVVSYSWLPALAYRLKGALLVKDFFNRGIISVLQAEPWFMDRESPPSTPVPMQEETLNPEQLQKNIDYVRHIGVSRAYLWGAEWWYWMKTVKGDTRYWDIAKNVVN